MGCVEGADSLGRSGGSDMQDKFQAGWLSGLTLFTGSFLLFLLQPLLGRTLLPLFGGGAAVWCVALALFQILLVVGYGYAHLITASMYSKQRGVVWRKLHLGVGGVVWLLMVVSTLWRGALLEWVRLHSGGAAGVALSLVVLVALPYLVLSAGSTYVQALEAGRLQRRVYSLYALSNAGSLAGLFFYPLVFEPWVALRWQWWLVLGGFGVYLVALGLLRPAGGAETGQESKAAGVDEAATRGQVVLWLVLAGVAVMLLNSSTAYLMLDVTPMPLLWVVLLAAYLVSFMLGFMPVVGRWYRWWGVGGLVALFTAAYTRSLWGAGSFVPNVVNLVLVLVFAGTVLHGWLYELRPRLRRELGWYYFVIAVGGALGGVLTSLVAPLVFDRVVEYPLALGLAVALVSARLVGGGWQRGSRVGVAVVVAWCLALLFFARDEGSNTIYRGRNFYGMVAVTRTLEEVAGEGIAPVHYLWSGQTTHGVQSFASQRRGEPLAYYSMEAGGVAFAVHSGYQEGEPVRVGVVGLGAGTLACYGRRGDVFRFYEINPLMIDVATNGRYFRYLPDAPMRIDLVEGDARQMLQVERDSGDPRYDILVIDAYSGDAVPMHLATREAFELYLERLEEGGVLAVHVSNWHIDLLPLCKAASEELGLYAYGRITSSDGGLSADSVWVYLTRNPMIWPQPMQGLTRVVEWERVREFPLPSDELGSLTPLVRW